MHTGKPNLLDPFAGARLGSLLAFVPDLGGEDLAVLVDRQRLACIRNVGIERGIVERVAEHERNAARSGDSERTNGVPDADEIRKRRIACFDRIAAVVGAEFLTECDAFLLLLVVTVMLVDLADRFLGQRGADCLVAARALAILLPGDAAEPT